MDIITQLRLLENNFRPIQSSEVDNKEAKHEIGRVINEHKEVQSVFFAGPTDIRLRAPTMYFEVSSGTKFMGEMLNGSDEMESIGPKIYPIMSFETTLADILVRLSGKNLVLESLSEREMGNKGHYSIPLLTGYTALVMTPDKSPYDLIQIVNRDGNASVEITISPHSGVKSMITESITDEDAKELFWTTVEREVGLERAGYDISMAEGVLKASYDGREILMYDVNFSSEERGHYVLIRHSKPIKIPELEKPLEGLDARTKFGGKISTGIGTFIGRRWLGFVDKASEICAGFRGGNTNQMIEYLNRVK